MTTAGSDRIETFDVTLPCTPSVVWEGSLYRSRIRTAGRRIVVRSQPAPHTGIRTTLFDSDDCFDLANARNELDLWLGEIEKVIRPGPVVGAMREELVSVAATR